MNQDINAYLELVEKRKAAQTPLELQMPSGATWLYLPINKAQYLVEGILPLHLVSKLESVKNAPQPKISTEDLEELGMAAFLITRETMLSNLVFPRISLTPKEDCILPTQIDPEDFQAWQDFVMRGAQADANLKSQSTSKKRK